MALHVADIALPRRDFELHATLTVGPETVAIVGPSGAGKTSLLRIVAGLEHPDRGQITLNGGVWLDTSRKVNLKPERRHVGYLPQDYALFPHLSVADNVRFAARRQRPDLIQRLGIDHLAHAKPSQLSGGERQRAALARALARDPRVLLLDEPFGALDPLTRRYIRDELADILADVALPTLLVTHSFADAIALADRVGVIDRGRIVQLDTPTRVQDQPATQLVAALTGSNILTGTATPIPEGARVQIDGGGTLTTDATAAGRVQLAVHPWALTVIAPDDAPLVDTVVNAHQEGGTLELRLTRLTVRVPPRQTRGTMFEPGTLIGLSASPGDVRVFAAEPNTSTASPAQACAPGETAAEAPPDPVRSL